MSIKPEEWKNIPACIKGAVGKLIDSTMSDSIKFDDFICFYNRQCE